MGLNSVFNASLAPVESVLKKDRNESEKAICKQVTRILTVDWTIYNNHQN